MGETQEMAPKKRGRPKKQPIEENKEIINEQSSTLQMSKQEEKKEPTTIKQVQMSLTGLFNEVLSSKGLDYQNRDMLYNPFIQNERLKLISSYPSSYSPDTISNFLQNPQYHELELRGLSAALSASQYLYYQILRASSDVPLFKTVIVPPSLEKNEYTSKSFTDEEEFVCDWIKAFNPVNTGRRVQMEVKREGKATYLFRQSLKTVEGKKTVCYVHWQKLPTQYVKLTGIGTYGYTASFNLLMFMQPGFSPLHYPDFIQQIWNDMITGKIITKTKKGKFSVDLNKLRSYVLPVNKHYQENTRGILEIEEKAYMYWIPLPEDVCFTFASDMSNAWAVPDTIGLFPALQELTDYSTLAGLIASTPLTAVLTGEAEPVPNAQPGQDQFVLSPHTMTSFINTWNNMASSNTQAFFAPFKNLKLQSLPNVPNSSDIKTKAVQNFISTAGAGGLITATDKPSVAMIKGAQALTASQYDYVTQQMARVLNANLKNHGACEYEWNIQLWGDIFSFNETVRLLKEGVQTGAVFLLPKLASAYDLTMRDVRALGNYMDAFKIYDLFKPLQGTQNQFNNKSHISSGEVKNPVGRPSLGDDEVTNDNTAASKDAGDDTGEMRRFVDSHKCLNCGLDTEEGHLLCEECETLFGIDV